MIFPQGLAYDAKKEDYRTPKYNSVFGYIAELVKDLKETKNRTSHFFNDQSGSVPGGSNLSNFLDDFQAIRMLRKANFKSNPLARNG